MSISGGVTLPSSGSPAEVKCQCRCPLPPWVCRCYSEQGCQSRICSFWTSRWTACESGWTFSCPSPSQHFPECCIILPSSITRYTLFYLSYNHLKSHLISPRAHFKIVCAFMLGFVVWTADKYWKVSQPLLFSRLQRPSAKFPSVLHLHVLFHSISGPCSLPASVSVWLDRCAFGEWLQLKWTGTEASRKEEPAIFSQSCTQLLVTLSLSHTHMCAAEREREWERERERESKRATGVHWNSKEAQKRDRGGEKLKRKCQLNAFLNKFACIISNFTDSRTQLCATSLYP